MKKPYFGSLHSHMRKLYNLPRNVPYEKKVALLNDALKVTFVRHPFVRLVSTYQDKLTEQNFHGWRQLCMKGAEPERFQMRETCSVHWETCHRLEVYGPIFKYDMSNGSI